nr:hypothetical protein Iba_chr01bCG7170 [Ipomoea batatas]
MVAVTASTEERTTSAVRRKRSTRKWSPQICGGKASRVCGRSAEERLAGSAEGRDGMAAVAMSAEERTASAERRKRSTRKWSPQICGGKVESEWRRSRRRWRRGRCRLRDGRDRRGNGLLRSAEERLARSAKGRDEMAAVAASTEERTTSAERRKRSTRKWSPHICGGKVETKLRRSQRRRRRRRRRLRDGRNRRGNGLLRSVEERSRRNGNGRGVDGGEDNVG